MGSTVLPSSNAVSMVLQVTVTLSAHCSLALPLAGFIGGLCMPIGMIRRSKLPYKEERSPHQQLV